MLPSNGACEPGSGYGRRARSEHAAGTGLEIELAFSLTDAAAQRLLANPICGARPVEMRATYFDTPDFALRRAGYVLRIRREGRKWVQTLKSGSAGGLVRGEFERPIGDGCLDLGLIEQAGLPRDLLARLAELSPVFETHVRRRRVLVKARDAEIEVALDEGEVMARTQRTSLLEVEFELKRGGREALFEYARALAAGGGLRLSFASKFDRGYDLATGGLDEAVPYSPPVARRLATVESTVGALGGAALHQLGSNLDVLQLGPRRSALREAIAGAERLAALLSACPFLGEPALRSVAAELDWLLGQLTAAQDLDRFISHGFLPLAHRGGDRPAAAIFGRALLQARRMAYRRVQDAARSRRVGALLLNAAELTAVLPEQAGRPAGAVDQSVTDFALSVLGRCDLILCAAKEVLEGADVFAQAELQRDVKRMDYLFEAFDPALAPNGRIHPGRRQAFHRLRLSLDDLRNIDAARLVVKHTLEGLDLADEDLAARAIVAGGTVVVALFAKSTRAMRGAREALRTLMARSTTLPF